MKNACRAEVFLARKELTHASPSFAYALYFFRSGLWPGHFVRRSGKSSRAGEIRSGLGPDVYKRQPYGQAASTGDLVQPVQWSGEMHDDDLALV